MSSPEPDARTADSESIEVATTFHLALPYLERGQISEVRARGEIASVMAKNYASGGENLTHCHPDEEHCFVVLEGEVTFYVESDDLGSVLGPFEGIFLPKGTNYRFKNSSDRNLILVRFGAQQPGTKPSAEYPDGTTKTADTEPIARIDPVVSPGPGFADSARNRGQGVQPHD